MNECTDLYPQDAALPTEQIHVSIYVKVITEATKKSVEQEVAHRSTLDKRKKDLLELAAETDRLQSRRRKKRKK